LIGPCPAQTEINPIGSGKLERDTKTAANLGALSIVKV